MVFTAAEMKMAKQEHSRVSRNINEFKEKCRALLKRNAGVIDAGDFKVWQPPYPRHTFAPHTVFVTGVLCGCTHWAGAG